MTDLHSLVARMADELDHGRQCLMDDRRLTHPLADEARTLLADHVPGSTEMVQPPAAGEVAERLADGPILQWTENLLPSAECRYDHCTAETPFGRFLITWKSWKKYDCPTVDETPWGDWYGVFNSVDKAKAACQQQLNERLALCMRPKPQPPAAGEVAELVAWLRLNHVSMNRHGLKRADGSGIAEPLHRAAELLKRLASPACWELKPSPELIEAFQEGLKEPGVFVPLQPGEILAPPQPIPVSERLPEAGDCDAQGRCWIHMPDIGTAPSWRLVDPREIGPYHTHWLPAHALPLPLPSGEGEA